MNEELFERLVVAIEKQSTAFPWDSLISALALIASWITIFLLLKERAEKNRPYMQVSFELIQRKLEYHDFPGTKMGFGVRYQRYKYHQQF